MSAYPNQDKISLWSIKHTWQRLMTICGEYSILLKKKVLQLFLVNILNGICLASIIPLMVALIDEHNKEKALLWLMVMTVLFIVSSLLRCCAYDFNYNGQLFQVMAYLRSKVGKKLRVIPLQSVEQKHTGSTSMLLLGGIPGIFFPILTVLDLFLKALVIPICFALMMCFYDWRLALLLLFIFPLILPFYYWLTPKIKRSNQKIVLAQQKLSGKIIEYIQGLNILRSVGQQNHSEDFIMSGFAEVKDIQSASSMKSISSGMLMTTTVELAIFAIIFISCLFYVQGGLSFAVLIATLIVIIRLGEGLSAVVYYSQFFETVKSMLNALEAIFNEKELPVITPTQIPYSYDIAFDKVDFNYEGNNTYSLANITALFPQKKLTAIVGPSGCGKTTLIKLMQRFADPQQGTVSIGGIDIRQIEPDVLSNLISVVFQDVYLFKQSILDNIRMAKPEASMEEVITAAKLAYCDEFIDRLPNGYDTQVADIGGSLSGGERQRISIARAILKNAPIIILDEPTSSLDAQSEYWVKKAIERLLQDKTVIVISHNMNTITHADQILLIDEGKILEQGDHQQLMALNGLYQRFYQLSITTIND